MREHHPTIPSGGGGGSEHPETTRRLYALSALFDLGDFHKANDSSIEIDSRLSLALCSSCKPAIGSESLGAFLSDEDTIAGVSRTRWPATRHAVTWAAKYIQKMQDSN